VPAISTTESFGAKPDARAAAALRLCATGAAGDFTDRTAMIANQKRHHRGRLMVMGAGEKRVAAFDAVDEAIFPSRNRARGRTVIGAGRGIDLASSSITS